MQIIEEVILKTDLGDIIMYIAVSGVIIMLAGILLQIKFNLEKSKVFIIGALVSLAGVLVLGLGDSFGLETHKDAYKAYVEDVKVLEEKGYKVVEHEKDDIYLIEKVEK